MNQRFLFLTETAFCTVVFIILLHTLPDESEEDESAENFVDWGNNLIFSKNLKIWGAQNFFWIFSKFYIDAVSAHLEHF